MKSFSVNSESTKTSELFTSSFNFHSPSFLNGCNRNFWFYLIYSASISRLQKHLFSIKTERKSLLFCGHIYDMEGKLFSHRVRFFYFYLPIAGFRQNTKIARFWTWNFLSPNYGKFSVEYELTSKISQKCTNIGFLRKKNKNWFFEKSCFFWKHLDFFQYR